MKLKSHLQYERDFCNLMDEKGFHTERVAASGRRRYSVCDVILFSKFRVFMVEVKSTGLAKFRVKGLHGVVEKALEFNVMPLLAVYFKSSHSSQGSGKWVLKLLDKEVKEVTNNDRSDEI
jgi:Holliday junction resolvase